MKESALFSGMRTYLGKVRTLRNESRTRRLLGNLPLSVQKDIGWPDRDDDRFHRNFR
ncbi:MAG: hypothetical protein ACTHOP_13155 [Mesorhizobium sp.]